MAKKRFPLIVFCGMDGSGKTTLTNKLAVYLEKAGLKYETTHAHTYSISKSSFGIKEKTVKMLKYLFATLIPLILLDNLYTYYFKYHPILERKILICDRYFYDKVCRMIYYGVCNKHMAEIYLKLLPRPDYIFFLNISPKDACLRKEEYSEEEYSSFGAIYRFVANYLKATVVDTGLSVDACCTEIFKKLNLTKE